MLLRSSLKGTIGHVADSVLLGRDSNRDPDRYWVISIHCSNNDNSYNNVDGFKNLGNGSISHVFRCGSKCCQIPNKFVPVNNILSTTTNNYINALFLLVQPMLMTTPPTWFTL